jgi:bacilysin biosynthesis protein BacA
MKERYKMSETMNRSRSIEGDRSWCGYEEALEYLSYRSPLVVGTLGPEGTSSEHAASYFVDRFAPDVARTEIELFDSFQDLEWGLCWGDVDLAVVPHAYSRINEFYVKSGVDLLLLFICPTPTYGLVRREDVDRALRGCKLVTHPASLPLLPQLLDDRNPQEFDVELVSSTSVAARRVREGSADLAITNERAAREHGLELVATYGPIRMSWSVFIPRR